MFAGFRRAPNPQFDPPTPSAQTVVRPEREDAAFPPPDTAAERAVLELRNLEPAAFARTQAIEAEAAREGWSTAGFCMGLPTVLDAQLAERRALRERELTSIEEQLSDPQVGSAEYQRLASKLVERRDELARVARLSPVVARYIESRRQRNHAVDRCCDRVPEYAAARAAYERRSQELAAEVEKELGPMRARLDGLGGELQWLEEARDARERELAVAEAALVAEHGALERALEPEALR